MTILDETRDAFGAALFALGEDPNTTDPATIDAAADFLIEAKGVIAGFDSATYLDRLAGGELACAEAYSSDVADREADEPRPRVRDPAPGGAPLDRLPLHPDRRGEPEGTNEFIEFYLQPEISATNAATSQVDTGNEAAHGVRPAARCSTTPSSSRRPRRSRCCGSPRTSVRRTSSTRTPGPA